jgi:hypothetical protein
MRRKSLVEAVLVIAAASMVAVAMTYPFASQLGSVGRIETGDGQWSIWVVNWVARTLVADPLHVFDANIFYPHRGTLAYSETNLVTGALAVPAYWATRNPYLAHNLVLLLSFVLAAAGGYYLARYLTGSRAAAAVSGLLFAFCPYVFAHTAHIHLMLTAGLPFSLLAFHRLAEAPSAGRGAALGTVMALTGLSCGYYGIYAALVVSLASLYYLVSRRRWTDRRYYGALAAAAVVASVLLLPFIGQYASLGEGNRPVRELKDQFLYSANWSSYAASGGLAHRWMLDHIGEWRDVLFPGFTALAFGAFGLWAGLRGRAVGRDDTGGSLGAVARPRETTVFYSFLTVVSFWLSFGPKAGLYSIAYATFPFFSLMRAPARIGLLVMLGLSVLAGIGVAAICRNRRWPVIAAAAALAGLVEVTPVPVRFRPVPPHSTVYDTLALVPDGAVVEMPFFWLSRDFHRHTYYMRMSTLHWKPLVNGYSDHTPRDFAEMALPVHWFPTRESFAVLRRYSPRYVVFHLNFYDRVSRAEVLERIEQFRDYLRPLASDDDHRLYEIVAWPEATSIQTPR